MDNQKRLAEVAGLMPGKTALVWQGGQLTYAGLDGKVNQMARTLINLGIRKGDRVAIQLLNVPEFIISYFAIFRSGGVMVPINPVYKRREIDYILNDAQPKALVTAPEFMAEISHLPGQAGSPRIILVVEKTVEGTLCWEDLSACQSAEKVSVDYDESDTAEIIYTSGTTGVPKGAMLSHRNINSNTLAIIKELEISESERTLIVAPLFHIAAQTNCMATTFYAGGTNYLIPRWISALDTLKALEGYRITYFFGPPTMHTMILNAPESDRFDLSSIRILLTGAASMPVEVYNRVKERLGIEPLEGYGLSETSPVVTFNPLHGRRKPGSIGLPIYGVDAGVFDADGNELPPGKVGEIAVRGTNVFQGYWNKKAETAEVLKGEWFYTGDLAYKDEEGYIFIVDRKKDLIIRGGLNIYPREIEEEVYKYPGVLECAAVGVADPVMGEEVALFLALKEGQQIDIEQLKGFCSERMAKYKVPRYYRVVENLPKTASGKIVKTELRKVASEVF